MRNTIHFSLLACLAVASLCTTAEPARPFVNPYLADSTFPAMHTAADFTPTAGPIGPGRRLNADEILRTPIGPMNGFGMRYSSPYPNGKRVIWVGGYDRIAKLDADTLKVLATYVIEGNAYFGDEKIDRHIATIDRLDDDAFVRNNLKVWAEPFKHAGAAYQILSRNNEYYTQYLGVDGTVALRVYGEANAADPASRIQLRREWKIPPKLAKERIMSMNMTSDGWLAMVTADGTLIILSRDFTTQYSLKLPRQNKKAGNDNFFSAFVRNGIVTDDRGGIYIVTRDNMHRVQWTGNQLSLAEDDGAWSVPYLNGTGLGSGTTPGLMGWGPKEDHLVVIGDGEHNNNMVAFWRDRIPDDWKGLSGFDRRIAGVIPIHFGVSKTEEVKLENAPVIYGYGAFFDTIFPVERLPDQGAPDRQFLAESFLMHAPGHEALGGAVIRWNPTARKLKTAWQSQVNFAATLCTVSGATEILYCWGARNREWTLEGIDWNTGKSAFYYILGKSHRFNPLGGPILIAPNGAVDCGCPGGMGLVRVNPKRN